MKNKNIEQFEISPMQEYSQPAYPTRAESPSDTLKKLPARWVKHATVVACLGAMSLSALVGCATQFETHPPERCDDGLHGVTAAYNQYVNDERIFDVIAVRVSGGGAAAAPFYVAQLTEQEALGTIRNRLCEAGICFDSPVPDYEVSLEVEPFWGGTQTVTVTLSLFDERTRYGIVFPFRWSSDFNISRSDAETKIRREFSQQYGITVRFISNFSEFLGEYDWDEELVFTDEEMQEAGRNLNEQLLYSVNGVISRLRAEGVLEFNITN